MKRKVVPRILFAIGLMLCFYPGVSSLLERHRQDNVIATYEQAVKHAEGIDLVLEKAKQYNQMLSQMNHAQMLSSENYETYLNVSGTGIMGTIEIPKISVKLPVYHGTEEKTLAVGAGHLEGSALPAGTKNSRCVITGHRGLPNSRMFTRLDELETGDFFFLNVCNRTFAYKVSGIQVISPEEIEKLAPVAGEDCVSLVTCTPYGLNTHRLVVTGKRVAFQESDKKKLERVIPSFRELGFTILPFVILAIVIVSKLKRRKRENVKQYKGSRKAGKYLHQAGRRCRRRRERKRRRQCRRKKTRRDSV